MNKLKKAKNIDYTYILFKNSENGSGTVTRFDEIDHKTYISYHVDNEKQMKLIVEELQNQLGNYYKVISPKNFGTCIIIERNIYQ